MIRATLVLLIAMIVIPRLRRRSAAQRHLLWAGALAAAALLPALTSLIPAWNIEWARRITQALANPRGILTPPAPDSGLDIVIRASGIEPAALTLGGIAAAVWIAGALVALLLLVAEGIKLARLAASARPLSSTPWDAIACAIAVRHGLSQRPRLFQSSRTGIPITWGLHPPRIVLPSDASGWSDERVRVVLAHELAHVRRGDWLVHLFAEVVCAIYWFHPFFWIGRSGLCRESEQAADDEVLRSGVEGSTYAAHLLEIVRAARGAGRAPSTAAAMARTAHLERRVAALLLPGINRHDVGRPVVIAVTAVVGLLTLPLAALSAQGLSMDIAIRPTTLPLVPEGTGPAPMATAPSVRIAAAADATAPDIAEYSTPPLYSDQARQRRVEGVVTVAARIDERGQVSGARVVNGLGFGLDQNALVALRQWRFRPGRLRGVPAAMDAEMDIEFSLRNEAMNELIANDMATRVGPGVTPPRAVRVAELSPGAGRQRGVVVLDVVLLENGNPRIVRILRSASPDLDENAVRVFEQWRFSPALKDGRPVSVRITAEVNFHG